MKAASNKSAQIYLSEVESRTQGSKPRPKTQKVFEAKDRPSRGQGHRRRCSPNNNKKKVFKFFFRRSQKKVFKNFFRRSLYEETEKRSLQIFRKVSGVFQRNFNGLKMCPRGLHLCYLYVFFGLFLSQCYLKRKLFENRRTNTKKKRNKLQY